MLGVNVWLSTCRCSLVWLLAEKNGGVSAVDYKGDEDADQIIIDSPVLQDAEPPVDVWQKCKGKYGREKGAEYRQLQNNFITPPTDFVLVSYEQNCTNESDDRQTESYEAHCYS